MKKLEFSKPERDEIVSQIQRYFAAELDQEIGALPAEMLLGFFTQRIGGFYYNLGLKDAQAVLASKLDDINEAIYGLERDEPRRR